MASKQALLDSDDDEEVTLNINKDYAKKYSTWREKEELQKLKTKYGDEVGDSSSSSEEEDEDAEALTAAVDKNWFRVLAAVRSNDPRIYDKNVKFFDSEEEKDDSASSDSKKKPPKKKKKTGDSEPLTIRDYERKLVTERSGVVSDSDDDEEEVQKKTMAPSYYEEQESIKKSITSAIAEMSSDDDDEDILTQREKSKKEKEEEEEEYIQFLKGEKEKEDLKNDKEIADELETLKDFYSRPDVGEDEKLLWKIVLDQSYRRKSKTKDEDWYTQQMAELEEDEEAMEAQEMFEHKYNFRFEEPDKDFIKQYRRNPDDTLRQKVNKRAVKRKEIKERKLKESEQKREELRLLKKLKKNEVVSQLEHLMKENPEVQFSTHDLEEDFDPEAHDRLMKEKFEEFDQLDAGDDDEEKPVFDDDDDDFEDWDQYDESVRDASQTVERAGTSQTEENEDADYDDDDNTKFNMDADYEPQQSSSSSKKKKKKSSFHKVVEKMKPKITEVFEKYQRTETPYQKYLEDYFALDYSEYGYKYRNVVANDYGLKPDEMLWLPTRELNSWASIKKVVGQRAEADEEYEKRKYHSAKMQKKKRNVLPSLKKMDNEETYMEDIRPQALREKKRQMMEADDSDSGVSEPEPDQQHDSISPSSSSRVKKKRKAESADMESEAPSRKKKKVKRRTADGDTIVESLEASVVGDSVKNTGELSAKKKKKKKQKAAEDSRTELSVSVSEDGAEKTKKKKRKTGQQDSSQLSASVSQDEDGTPKKKKKKQAAQENDGQPPSNSSEQNVEQKKKKKKKLKGQEKGQASGPKSGKKGKGQKGKKKGSVPRTKGYMPKEDISASRLAALHVDPKKYKYIKDRITPLTQGDD